MFQINIAFLFHLNDRAIWPRWTHVHAGYREWALLDRACAVQFATDPAQPDSFVRTTCGHLSRLQAHITSLRRVSMGYQEAGWRRLCFQSRGLRENCQPGATAQTTGCHLLLTVSSVPREPKRQVLRRCLFYGREKG